MPRFPVYTRVDDYSAPGVTGWFDTERAEKFEPQRPTQHPRSNQGMSYSSQGLYQTDGGAWVRGIHLGSRGFEYTFVSDVVAHEWLVNNGFSDEAARRIELEPERGPGRPEIGGLVQVRLGDTLSAVDEYADSEGCSRAEAVRRLVIAGLRRL